MEMASPPPRSSSTDDDTAAPPPRSSWVILGSIPRVVQDDVDANDATTTTDLSLALAAPPLVSHLTVSRRVFPATPTPQNYPILLAAEPSGLLLLHSIIDAPAPAPRPPPTGVDDTDRRERKPCLYDWRLLDPRYLVLDATTGSALRLPNPDPREHIPHPALVGVVSCPGGGRYAVAELVPGILGSDTADLRCYSSDLGEWVTKAVRYPLQPRRLSPICTLAHDGRLWWADYSWGIVTADPFADDPVLGFVPLPSLELGYGEGWGDLDRLRYVGVSAGSLRFVDTYRRRELRNKVTVWTLVDPNATSVDTAWTLEHEATFADIWADDTYKATGLPRIAPLVALIHPHNPAVVYFFLRGHLFAVDLPARKVLECDRYHLVAPPRNYPIANRFIRAWELPPVVSSGLENWSRDIRSSEPTEAPPTRSMGDWKPNDYHFNWMHDANLHSMLKEQGFAEREFAAVYTGRAQVPAEPTVLSQRRHTFRRRPLNLNPRSLAQPHSPVPSP